MLAVEHPVDARVAQARRDALGMAGQFVAGGTALQLAWQDGPPELTLVAVAALPGARDITTSGTVLRLGAGLPLETVRTHPAVRAGAPLLSKACDTLAALPVRHLATLGGNVGWRCGDTLAPLLALAAEAELADGRRLPLDTVLGDAALPLITALCIDTRSAGWPSVFEKVGQRAAFSPSRLAFARVWSPDGVRLAAGGAGLPVRRLRAAEVAPDGPALAAACLADLGDLARARLAHRLIEGHGR